jgi:hypothetical protein
MLVLIAELPVNVNFYFDRAMSQLRAIDFKKQARKQHQRLTSTNAGYVDG